MKPPHLLLIIITNIRIQIGDGSGIECCSSFQTGVTPSTPPHPECLPISVPANDPKFNPSGNGAINCMTLIRSTFGNNLDGTTPTMRTQVCFGAIYINNRFLNNLIEL